MSCVSLNHCCTAKHPKSQWHQSHYHSWSMSCMGFGWSQLSLPGLLAWSDSDLCLPFSFWTNGLVGTYSVRAAAEEKEQKWQHVRHSKLKTLILSLLPTNQRPTQITSSNLKPNAGKYTLPIMMPWKRYDHRQGWGTGTKNAIRNTPSHLISLETFIWLSLTISNAIFSEVNFSPYTYGQLILDNSAKPNQWRENSLEIHVQNNEVGPHTICKY